MSIIGENPLLAQRPDINPYRYVAGEILNRLKWDIRPESWRSRAKLRHWRDRYLGKKAVILCNGPSLNRTDLTLLDGVFTFGLNKINLLFERSQFRPDCIVAVNRLVLEQNAAFYNETGIPLFLDSHGCRWIKSRDGVCFLHSSNQMKFARDVSMSVQQGFTVTYVAMQLAFHLGFRDIALVGCDHNFAHKGPANQTVTATGSDESHFHPGYFSGGQSWQLPDLAGSEHFYSLAGETFAAHGGLIVNCTEGGRLELFPRLSLEEWKTEK